MKRASLTLRLGLMFVCAVVAVLVDEVMDRRIICT